ncbi:hypothetical protein CQ14_34450 [Bradyrhizobium lablabi]|uniref:HAMP domain-containing protein n=1 Tax=Bradyrhizobium lablabi TaxID=722472 RepID=A0A0R3MP27_9BRAD|nr:hypothetical protein [Bradyrhizobium lablabi]KRR19685.1 hypothetical protein CQ14_34450 [Bradyrhizobium lablabi]
MAGRRLSLRTLVFFGGAMLMLVLAVVTAVLYTAALQRRAEELRVEKLTTRGELSANLLARRLHGVWMDVARLATLIDSTNPASAREQIQFMSRLDTRYSWLGVSNLEGKVLAATDGTLEGERVEQEPWFRQGLDVTAAIDGNGAHDPAHLPPASMESSRSIDLAAPVQHAGSVTGVVGAQLNWNWVLEGMADLQAPGIEPVLLSRDRLVLFGPPDLVNKPLNIGSALAADRVNSSSLRERWPDGKDYFTVTVPMIGLADLPNLGWSLLIRQNADDAMAPTRELIRSFWVMLGTGALTALALLYLAAQWLRTPLRRLSEAAEAIVRDPASRAPYAETRFEEAARLSNALARMQSKLMDRSTS